MMTETPIEMWWPSPSALDALTVEDVENGFDLSAPDGTECGEWLAFWTQDEAHHKVFEDEFIAVLRNHANKVLETHGETEAVTDEQSAHREQTEEECPGTVA